MHAARPVFTYMPRGPIQRLGQHPRPQQQPQIRPFAPIVLGLVDEIDQNQVFHAPRNRFSRPQARPQFSPRRNLPTRT